MPRRPRKAIGGIVDHVLNRAVGKLKSFEQDDDYAAFERVLEEASIGRAGPFGDEPWTKAMTRQLALESTLRPRGRPRKPKREGDQTA